MQEFKNLDRELYRSLEQHTGEGEELKASYTRDAIEALEQDDYSEGDNN